MRTEQAHEIGDAAPTSLAHLVGQRSVVEQVKVALDAAQQDGKKFDHAALVGGSVWVQPDLEESRR